MATPGPILDGFGWDAIASETIDLYRSLCARRTAWLRLDVAGKARDRLRYVSPR